MPNCNHKCHTVGLNPWVEDCPICKCPNPRYDKKLAETVHSLDMEEFLHWLFNEWPKIEDQYPKLDPNYE